MSIDRDREVRYHMQRGFYATRPTQWTVFLRTFLPWQLWRFAMINLKMFVIIAASHKGHR